MEYLTKPKYFDLFVIANKSIMTTTQYGNFRNNNHEYAVYPKHMDMGEKKYKVKSYRDKNNILYTIYKDSKGDRDISNGML